MDITVNKLEDMQLELVQSSFEFLEHLHESLTPKKFCVDNPRIIKYSYYLLIKEGVNGCMILQLSVQV